MYSCHILNHSPSNSNKHTVTEVGSDVAYPSHQLFYHNNEHSIDIDTFRAFGEPCTAYNLQRDLKADPVRT